MVSTENISIAVIEKINKENPPKRVWKSTLR